MYMYRNGNSLPCGQNVCTVRLLLTCPPVGKLTRSGREEGVGEAEGVEEEGAEVGELIILLMTAVASFLSAVVGGASSGRESI